MLYCPGRWRTYAMGGALNDPEHRARLANARGSVQEVADRRASMNHAVC